MTAACRIVFEDTNWPNLLPLVYWRSVGELRCGRRMLLEQHIPQSGAAVLHSQPGAAVPHVLWVRPGLAAVTTERFPNIAVNAPISPDATRVLLLNARWLMDPACDALPFAAFGGSVSRLNSSVSRVDEMPPTVGVCQGQIAFLVLTGEQARTLSPNTMLAADGPSAEEWAEKLGRQVDAGGAMVNYPWDLVANNKARMLVDWKVAGPEDGPARCLPEDGPVRLDNAKIYPGVYLLDESNIRIGPGSIVKPCTVLDAEEGPIWIGSNVRISPHCTIQGPVVICDNTLVQPGAVIREGTTIGPTCKVGGEIEDSIIWGYSNKQHDGFLGHAVLGSWINIAADSVNSDLKNTYGPIRVPINGVEVDSGRMFVGLTMGDHSKSSINSSFATGTVVGFCSNVICNAFPPKFVPSFCWLTDAGGQQYDPQRGLAVAKVVMARRKIAMSAAEEKLFLAVAEQCRQIETAGSIGPAEA